MRIRKQFAALPYVLLHDRAEVCLISSRGTGRWIIPKGWPQKSLKPHELAAREAFEEAGLHGRVDRKAIGRFRYDKRLDNESEVVCDVTVFAMRVDLQALDWPEKDQRVGLWVGVEEAAGMVDDAGLAALLQRFEPRLSPLSQAGGQVRR